MIPMSPRNRALIKFPIKCSLFVSQKIFYSFTGMARCYIKSASATMLGTRRQANRFSCFFILYYDNSGTSVCAPTIQIPNGWTPKLFLGLLLQEWCLINKISLFGVEDKACDDSFRMQLLYYNCNATQLMELVRHQTIVCSWWILV
jgi:hypothetical protein